MVAVQPPSGGENWQPPAAPPGPASPPQASAPVTARDLDLRPPVIQAACHPGRPVTASYQDGILTLSCSLDGDEIIRIEVADGRPEHVIVLLTDECEEYPGRSCVVAAHGFRSREQARDFASQEREWAPHYITVRHHA